MERGEFSISLGSYEGLFMVYSCITPPIKKLPESNGEETAEAQQSTFGLLLNAHDHSSQIKCCSSCCDTGTVATGGADEIVQVYDVVRRTELATLTHHHGTVTSVEWLNGGEYLLSTGEDGLVCVWESKHWNLLHTLGEYKSGITCMSIHPAGRVALSVGRDRVLRTWNLRTGRMAYATNLKFVCDLVRWSPSGKYYVLTSQSQLHIYDTQTTDVVLTSSATGSINDICFIDDEHMCVGDQSGDVKLVTVSERRVSTAIPGAHGGRVKCLSYLPDATGTTGDATDTPGDATGTTGEATGTTGEATGTTGDATDSQGLLVTASTDGVVKVWRLHLQSRAGAVMYHLLGSQPTGSRITSMSVCESKATTAAAKATPPPQRVQRGVKSAGTTELTNTRPKAKKMVKKKVSSESPVLENTRPKAKKMVKTKVSSESPVLTNTRPKAKKMVKKKVSSESPVLKNTRPKAKKMVKNKVSSESPVLKNTRPKAKKMVKKKASSESPVLKKISRPARSMQRAKGKKIQMTTKKVMKKKNT